MKVKVYRYTILPVLEKFSLSYTSFVDLALAHLLRQRRRDNVQDEEIKLPQFPGKPKFNYVEVDGEIFFQHHLEKVDPYIIVNFAVVLLCKDLIKQRILPEWNYMRRQSVYAGTRRKYRMLDPHGRLYEFDNKEKFAKQHKIKLGKLYNFLRYSLNDCDGWTRVPFDYEPPKIERHLSESQRQYTYLSSIKEIAAQKKGRMQLHAPCLDR